ncbi:hypothetical protein GCM10022225_81960 [Plantactinospora mayteni]|uniref:Uncharacterized protein n=1 Tax=Plantactinospora mayteni TaxID=566021 RepID=A0ABQ4F406_9ACTN|nr:hypothetical protein [Plantactinospora mayteni]GIH01625.1 hypothetical protein Pma05_81970 [Plantactinospora mayteni]
MGKPPDLIAAEHALGSVDVERVPWYAADWLAAGHDGPALRELAGLDGSDTRLIGELLPDALTEVGVPVPSAAEAADTWLATLAQRLIDGEIDERTVSEHVSAFVSWHLDLDEIWHSPFTDLHVIVDEWDQGWGRGNQELAATVRQLCRDHLSRVPASPGLALMNLAHSSVDQQAGGLRRLLNEWDFIGGYNPQTNVDEYDCLIGPLLARLTKGADADDLGNYLSVETRGHFGITVSDTSIRAFARRLLAWWGTDQKAR